MPKVAFAGLVSEPTAAELRRLRFPPHHADSGLRLTCQCSVLGDIKVTKYTGLFGTGEEESDAGR